LCEHNAKQAGIKTVSLNLRGILNKYNTLIRQDVDLEGFIASETNNVFEEAKRHPRSIIIVDDIERVFITSKERDVETSLGSTGRLSKPHLIQECMKIPNNTCILVVGTTCYPDACVGVDRESFLGHFDAFIRVPPLDNFSRTEYLLKLMPSSLDKGKMSVGALATEIMANMPHLNFADIATAVENVQLPVGHSSDSVFSHNIRLIKSSLRKQYDRVRQERQERFSRLRDWLNPNSSTSKLKIATKRRKNAI